VLNGGNDETASQTRRVRIEVAEGFFGGPSRGHRCACCIEQLRDQRQSIGVVVNGQDVNRLLIPC
jgi:hypothetical protein